MLEPVARNKLSFRVLGLFQDGRGVVVGQAAAILLLSVERVVSMLRLLSEELSLDDLLPTLRIEVVENTLRSTSYLLSFQTSDSLLLDRVARLARLVGSPLCVGSSPHFVAYRDEEAPLGYDAQPLAEPGDLTLYTPAFVQPYRRIRALRLSQLLSQLQLLPLPGGLTAALQRPVLDGVEPQPASPSELYLTCGVGLSERLMRYLWQHGIDAELLVPDGLPRPEVQEQEQRLRESLIRMSSPPSELLLRIASLPTVKLLRPEGVGMLIELGFAHPMRLSSLQSLFPSTDLILFYGHRRGFVRAKSPTRIPLTRLILPSLTIDGQAGSMPLDKEAPLRMLTAATTKPLPLPISLRLVPRRDGLQQRPPTATLIPWSRLATLQRLLGLLSGDALWSLRAVGLPSGLFVFGNDAVQQLVSGQLLDEPAPLLFVPRSHQLLPELPATQLRALLSQSDEQLILFLPGEAQPLSLSKSLSQPLSLRLLSGLSVKDGLALPASVIQPEGSPTVQHESLSFFSTMPLWGLSSSKEGE
jgi:hypothetical protein